MIIRCIAVGDYPKRSGEQFVVGKVYETTDEPWNRRGMYKIPKMSSWGWNIREVGKGLYQSCGYTELFTIEEVPPMEDFL